MRLIIIAPDNRKRRLVLANNLKVASDEAHSKARKLSWVGREMAVSQRELGDFLHDIATQIERA